MLLTIDIPIDSHHRSNSCQDPQAVILNTVRMSLGCTCEVVLKKVA